MGVTSRWINPDAVPLKDGHFNDNGTFRAEHEGKYGFTKATVNVQPDRIVGKDPDTGEDTEIREVPQDPDPGGGGGGGDEKPPRLVETVLPSQIAVTVPPARTRYMPGDTIDYSGIGVQAQLNSGQAWDGFPNGMIPFEELIFPVKRLPGPGDRGEPVTGAIIPEFDAPSSTGTMKVTSLGRLSSLADYSYERIGEMIDLDMRDPFGALKDAIRALHEEVGEANEPSDVMFADISHLWIGSTHTFDTCQMNAINIRYMGERRHLDLSEVKITPIGKPPFEIKAVVYCATYRAARLALKEHFGDRFDEYWEKYQADTNCNMLFTGFKAISYDSDFQTWPYQGEGNGQVVCETTTSLVEYVPGRAVSNLNAYFASDDSAGAFEVPIYTATGDLDCGIEQPIRFSSRGMAEADLGESTTEYRFEGARVALTTDWNSIGYVLALPTRGTATITEGEHAQTVSLAGQFRRADDDRVAYYAAGRIDALGTIVECAPDTGGNLSAFLSHAGQIAWTMLYGGMTETTLSLPVQWERPGDEKVLETAFDIAVAMPVE